MNKFLLPLFLLGLSIVSFNIQADSNQSPFSKKYVQCYAIENDSFFGENYKDSCGPIGWASYHFVMNQRFILTGGSSDTFTKTDLK